MNQLLVGSCFSGLGSIDRAFEQVGYRVIWQSEIDKAANRVLTQYWPGVPNLGDISTIDFTGVPVPDVLVGGFPCQDVSVAGRRAGLDGKRSGLWFEFHRALRELRPRWVVVENVPGLLTNRKGRDFAVILHGLVELGYGVCWRVLDAQYARVAQQRRRVFVVGHRGGTGGIEVLFESEGLSWDSPPRREAGTHPATTLTAGVAASRGVNSPGRRAEDDVNLIVADALTSAHRFGADVKHAQANHLIATEPESVIPILEVGARQGKKYDQRDGIGIGSPGDPMFTLQAGKQHGIAHTSAIAGYSIRRLTPTEGLRLQGLPDDYLDLDPPLSDSAKYRLIGNAAAVPVLRWIAERMTRAERTSEVAA